MPSPSPAFLSDTLTGLEEALALLPPEGEPGRLTAMMAVWAFLEVLSAAESDPAARPWFASHAERLQAVGETVDTIMVSWGKGPPTA